MSEETRPAAPQAQTATEAQHAKLTADRLRDCAQLFRDCVFPGSLAGRVAASIQFLELSANAMQAAAGEAKTMAKAEEKRQRKQLKRQKLAAVPDAPEAKTDG